MPEVLHVEAVLEVDHRDGVVMIIASTPWWKLR
jgi:hypothetical protein